MKWMPDREKYIEVLSKTVKTVKEFNEDAPIKISLVCIEDILELLKEQDELLKHEYWRGYNNGRADERGLQEGTIMQTFSPD